MLSASFALRSMSKPARFNTALWGARCIQLRKLKYQTPSEKWNTMRKMLEKRKIEPFSLIYLLHKLRNTSYLVLSKQNTQAHKNTYSARAVALPREVVSVNKTHSKSRRARWPRSHCSFAPSETFALHRLCLTSSFRRTCAHHIQIDRCWQGGRPEKMLHHSIPFLMR